MSFLSELQLTKLLYRDRSIDPTKKEESTVVTNQYTTDNSVVQNIVYPDNIVQPSGTTSTATLTVREIDGSPNVIGVTTMRFSNSSVTDNGGGTVTVTTGGGGGSPGGSTTQVQYNDTGAFAGSAFLTFDPAGGALYGEPLLTLFDASSTFEGTLVLSRIVAHPDNGNIFIGDDTDTVGAITIQNANSPGYGINIISGGYEVLLQSGSSGGGLSASIRLYNAGSSTPYGEIYINPGRNNSGDFGNVIQQTGNLCIGDSPPSTNSFDSSIVIMNANTTPSASVTGGGILYVESGALKYRGAGGTVTTIATS